MILDVTYPPITSYPLYADLLAATIHIQNSWEWYCNNYIQLFTDYRFVDHGEVKFRDNLFGTTQWCPYSWSSYSPFVCDVNFIHDFSAFFDFDNIVSQFQKLIDQGYYLRLMLDRHYVNNQYPKGKFHPAFVYGYDQGMFYVADFVQNGKYVFTTISDSSIFNSYRGETELPAMITNKHNVSLFKTKYSEYKYDFVLLRSLLSDYFNEINTIDSHEAIHHCKSDKPTVWGMAIYRYLISYLESVKRSGTGVDSRGIYAMKDHKVAMCHKLEFLIKCKHIDDYTSISFCESMKQQLEKCVSLCIKYNLNGDVRCLERIADILKYVYDKEKRVIEELIANI